MTASLLGHHTQADQNQDLNLRQQPFVRLLCNTEVATLFSLLTIDARTSGEVMETLRQLVSPDGTLHTWAEGLLAGACCVFGALLVRTMHGWRQEKRLTARAQNRREHSFQRAREAVRMYKEKRPLSDSNFILSLSLSELTEKLQEGSLSPEEVFYAYMDKALDVQQKLNSCTEVILESFEQLKTIDSGKKGILYGVPVSLKENLVLKNYDSCCGVVKFIDQPGEDDCVLVKVLKKQGAIPFVRTNFPQALLNYDSSNPIYGMTLNPFNLQKTSGGSSSGEGALIGGGGSVIGVGSDIGGSVRIPSKGFRVIYRGQKTVLSTAGPMAKDVESLALFMKAVLCDDMFKLDPTVPPLPFNEELVPYKPVRISEMTELMANGILADGGTTFLQQFKGTTVDPGLKAQVQLYRMPSWLKKMIAFLLKPLWPYGATIFRSVSGVGSVAGLWKLHASIEDIITDTIAEWKRLNIDVVLCPIIGPAFNFNYCGKLNCMLPYSMAYNLLNFSAGVVPVSTVTAQDEKNLSHLASGNLFERTLNKALKGSEGLPVGVQRWRRLSKNRRLLNEEIQGGGKWHARHGKSWNREVVLSIICGTWSSSDCATQDQEAHGLYDCRELHIAMFDTAGDYLLR
ncbi:hypothetical protein WMY93_024479 [Mugilogobius chulae]|uniref:Amidase domain-containing protein n=1 Tax=Mugilogobius chulae TaxID=88201 RepID=A0AAW0N5B7_9GOBI